MLPSQPPSEIILLPQDQQANNGTQHFQCVDQCAIQDQYTADNQLSHSLSFIPPL